MTEPPATSAQDLSYDGIEMNKPHGPWKYPLKDRIDRYLQAVENQHPWHRERSPWGPPVAPPAILGNAALRFIDSIAPVPPGTLHARQEIETAAALRRDRRLIGYGEFVEKYEKRGRRWFVFEARWRDETGLIIGRSRTAMAFPERVETGDARPATGEKPEPPRKGELTAITRKLTQEKLTAYSEDSVNALRGTSIHVHPEVAKAAGFPATVAQGMMAGDYISEMMTNALGKEWFAYATLSLAFLRPALCGDTLTAGGRLAERIEEGAVERRVYEVWCRNQHGETVAAGTAASLVMPDKPL
ncbi:MAG: MaoC family dehydratase [Dehalococcoidia bacterium]|nr:MaoC family dehydratase [Dehalococcoidia bacterium]